MHFISKSMSSNIIEKMPKFLRLSELQLYYSLSYTMKRRHLNRLKTLGKPGKERSFLKSPRISTPY